MVRRLDRRPHDGGCDAPATSEQRKHAELVRRDRKQRQAREEYAGDDPNDSGDDSATARPRKPKSVWRVGGVFARYRRKDRNYRRKSSELAHYGKTEINNE